MLQIKNSAGVVIHEVSDYTVSNNYMSDNTVTCELMIPIQRDLNGKEIPVSFEYDWNIEHRGKTFLLDTIIPTGEKSDKSLQIKYNLTFMGKEKVLKDYLMRDLMEVNTETYLDYKTVFTFHGNIHDVVRRLQYNLNKYFGMDSWIVDLNPSETYTLDFISVDVNNMYLWDFVQEIYNMFQLTYTFEEEPGNVMRLKIGYPETEIEHVFEYSGGLSKSKGGLVSITRTKKDGIYTLLSGVGGERNIPVNYYKLVDKSFLTDGVYTHRRGNYLNLMPKVFRMYTFGYNDAEDSIAMPVDFESWKDFYLTRDGGQFKEINFTEKDYVAYKAGYDDFVAGIYNPIDFYVSPNVDKHGYREGILEPNEAIYPSIAGVTRPGIGRIDELVDVEQITGPMSDNDFKTIDLFDKKGDVEVIARQNYSTSVVEKFVSTEEFSITKDQMDVCHLIFDTSSVVVGAGYTKVQVMRKLDGGSWEVVEEFIREVASAPFRDITGGAGDTGIPDSGVVESPTRPRPTVVNPNNPSEPPLDLDDPNNTKQIATYEHYFTTPGTYKMVLTSGVKFGISNGRPSQNGGVMTSKLFSPKLIATPFKQLFDIWVKDLGFNLADMKHWGTEEAVVNFTTGLLAGEDYEFMILRKGKVPQVFVDETKSVACMVDGTMQVVKSKYRITLQKSDADYEAIGKYLPTDVLNARPLDKFILLKLELPFEYVYWAEERYQNFILGELANMDDDNPEFSVTLDKTFLPTFSEEHLLTAGNFFRIRNLSLIDNTDYVMHIKGITFTYKDKSIYPDITLSVGNDLLSSTNPFPKINSDLRQLSSNMYSSEQAIEKALTRMDSRYLRKDFPDRAYRKIAFSEPAEFDAGFVTNDFQQGYFTGSGAGLYDDLNKSKTFEVDNMIVRKQLILNELVINQVKHNGGIIVFSAANMVCSSSVKNEDGTFTVYFDRKDGKINNEWEVGDIAYCQRADISMEGDRVVTKYYKRKVQDVGVDYILLSNDGYVLEGVNSAPEENDTIVQYGNMINAKRQSIIEFDTTNGGRQTFFKELGAGSDPYTLSNKNFIDIGHLETGDGVWRDLIRIFGEFYVGSRDGSQFVRFNSSANDGRGAVEISAGVMIGGKFTDLSSWIGGTDANIGKIEGDVKTAQDTASAAITAISQTDYKLLQVIKTTENLQDQVDGAISTFYSYGVPTLLNYPAMEWRDEDTRLKHEGDMYFNKDNNKAYRFFKDVDGKWYWALITDTDITESLRKSEQALAVGQSKRTVFVSKPTNVDPVSGMLYEQGDLLNPLFNFTVNTFTYKAGKMYRANKANQVFMTADWEEVAYTDDTKALEALAVANTAKTSAEAANKDIASLNTYVDGAFADGLIDEAEAKQIAEQLKNINETKVTSDSSYSALYSNALLDGTAKSNLSASKTDLDSKRTTLITSINTIVSNGKVTDALRNAYNTAYSNYTTSYGTFSTRIQEATRTIEANGVNKGVEIIRKKITVDASTLDQNTYYPVIIRISATLTTSIEVNVGLDSGTKPAWSTHVGGFSCRFEEEVNGSGWGTSTVNRLVKNSTYNFATDNPIGNVGQLTNSSDEYIYVRGGGKYYFVVSNGVNPVLQTSRYDGAGGEYVSPLPLASVDFTTNKVPLNVRIDDSKNKADAAQAAINAMNDDSVFDISEKQAIRTQWEAISGVSNTIDYGNTGSYYIAFWAASNASVSNTVLQSAYVNLRSYLNTWQLYTNENKSGFVRVDMANLFKAYYNEETAVYDKISKGYVDKLEIGGTNLLDGSEKIVVTAPAGANYHNQPIKVGKVVSGEEYTFSVESIQMLAGSDHRVSILMYQLNGDISLCQYQDIVFANGEKSCLLKITKSSDNAHILLYAGGMGSTSGKSVQYNFFKLEKGNKATDWSPSVFDQQEANRRLISMADDNIITKEEKAQLRNDYEQMKKNYNAIVAQADSAKVSRTALDNAWSNINTLFGSSFVNISSNTDFTFSAGKTRDTYNSQLADWQAQYNKLGEEIAKASIQIGGVNYLNDSQKTIDVDNLNTYDPQFGSIDPAFLKGLGVGDTVTIGADISPLDMSVSNTYTLYLEFVKNGSQAGVMQIPYSLNSGRISQSFTATSVHVSADEVRYVIYRSGNGKVKSSNRFIFKGKLMDWTPSIADQKADQEKLSAIAAKNIPLYGLDMYMPLDATPFTDTYKSTPVTNSGVTLIDDAKFIKAADFNAASYKKIDVANFPCITTANYTVSAWVKRAIRLPRYCCIIGNVSGDSTGFKFGVTSNQDVLTFRNGSQYVTIQESALTLNKWTFVSMVVNANQIKVYVNGELKSGSPTASSTSVSSRAYIGSTGGNNYNHFTGQMSSLTVHNRALSQDEISLMSTTKMDYITNVFKEASAGTSSVDGGLTLTQVVGARNSDNKVTAIMSGLGTENTAFAAGIPTSGANEGRLDLSKYRVTHAGDLYAENAFLKGTVEATSGTIGGMGIFNNKIQILNMGENTGLSFGNEGIESAGDLEAGAGWIFYDTRVFSKSWDRPFDPTGGGGIIEPNPSTWGPIKITLPDGYTYKIKSTNSGSASWNNIIDNPRGAKFNSGTDLSFSAELDKATTRILSVYGSYRNDGTSMLGDVMSATVTNMIVNIDVLKQVSQVKVGNNGMYAFFNNNAYMHFKTWEGFATVSGSSGLRGFKVHNGNTYMLLNDTWFQIWRRNDGVLMLG